MALKMTYIREQSPRPRVRIDQRLYRTRDGRLVTQGNPDAAFLFCSAGKEVDVAEFERYRLDVPETVEAGEESWAAEPGRKSDLPAGGEEGQDMAEKQPEKKRRRGHKDKRRKVRTEDK